MPIPLPKVRDETVPSKFQFYLNDYFINNFLNAVNVENRDFVASVGSADIGFEISTSTLAIIFKGIKPKYGDAK